MMGCTATKIQSNGNHLQRHSDRKNCKNPENHFVVTHTKAEVLRQLEEDGAVERTIIADGGVSFGISLNGNFDENLNVDRSILPTKLLERLKRNIKVDLDREEREILASVMRADDLKCKADKARLTSDKQAVIKQRREEWEILKRDKYEQKMQYIEEIRQRKKQIQKDQTSLSSPAPVN